MPTKGCTTAAEVDLALASWRQGDLIVISGDDDRLSFVYIADLALPLTAEAQLQAEEASREDEPMGLAGISKREAGFAVLTQTCDIVRPCHDRSFLELAPLVTIAHRGDLEDIRKERRPAFAWLPEAAQRGWAVNLDRVMTVEKSVIAARERLPGWTDEADLRRFARALARKRARFAFPDDVVRILAPLRTRLTAKAGKQSDAGAMIAQIRQIRIRATPSRTSSGPIEITPIFVIEDGITGEARAKLCRWVQDWCAVLQSNERYSVLPPIIHSRDDLTARDMDDSDQLDLDHLSIQGAAGLTS